MDTIFHKRLSRVSALTPVRRCEPVPEVLRQDDADRMAVLGAVVERNSYGEHLVARQWYATPEMCQPEMAALLLLLPPLKPQQPALLRGSNRRRSDRETVSHGDRQASQRVADAAGDPANWLFLDVETTGLAGGTGTYAFLVGLAWWDGGGITVEQLFMRDHDEEHSVLLEIARRVKERPVLVTFNGKSFDWPLLETRFRMTRAIEAPVCAAHLDMLHPARQLWRLKLGSARLSHLETHVLGSESLGWSRTDDIDSSRIPEMYFCYLRGGPAEPLAGVFRHNRWDLRGLAALAGRIFRVLGDPETVDSGSDGALERYGISRLLSRRGERVKARAQFERALDAGLPKSVDRTARHELARLVKRERDYRRAAELWEELASESGPSFEACEQLAIHYEKNARDPQEAARISRFALGELRSALRLGLIAPYRHAHFLARFERRLARLQGRLAERLEQTARRESLP